MLRGIIYLVFSALSFALATVFVKLVTANTEIPGIELSFFRFLFGLLITLFYVLHRKKSIKPVKSIHVYMRAIFNTIAVLLFFTGVEYSNVSKANLLNMTYPVFVFLIAPFLNKEKAPKEYLLYLLITCAGIYLTMVPSGAPFNRDIVNIGDIAALLSGVTAGFAITTLREARKYNHSYIIVFYLMLIGTIINGIMVIPVFISPHGIYILYILLCALFSYIGQYCITEGYRHIDAAPGSLISATRIIFALALGNILFGDPVTPRIIAGSALIMFSLSGISGFFRYLSNQRQIKAKKMDA
jgi:drug/metabolite transporter (DMT)-like permease